MKRNLREELRKFFKISDFNEYNVLKNFHLAYALSCNEDIEKKENFSHSSTSHKKY